MLFVFVSLYSVAKMYALMKRCDLQLERREGVQLHTLVHAALPQAPEYEAWGLQACPTCYKPAGSHLQVSI